jgi:hypothetical protein
MTELSLGARPGVNFPVLDAELREALPFMIDGIAWDKRDNLTVIVSEGEDAAALRGAIAEVIAAHDPTQLTPQQAAEIARAEAAQAVAGADLAAKVQAVVGATTLEELRPVLLDALDLLNKMAVAQGLVPPASAKAAEDVAVAYRVAKAEERAAAAEGTD